ncbi:MAG: ABC transporter permease [Mobilitalea sp.]
MRFRDLYKMALENLFRRKLRTCLTVLSIVIGTTSIILMIALGMGMQTTVLKEFDSYGSVNVLQVSKKEEDIKTSRFYDLNVATGLSDDDVLILESLDGVELAAPVSSISVTIFTTNHFNNVVLVGLDPFLMEELDFQTMEGRLPRDNVLEAVFGDKALEEFQKTPSDNPNAVIQRPAAKEEEIPEEKGITISFGDQSDKDYPFEPLSERYKFQFNLQAETLEQNAPKLYSLCGVGILKEGDMMKDYNVYVPLNIFEKLLKANYEAQGMKYKTSYSQIMVKVKDLEQIKMVKKSIEDNGYAVFSLMSILDVVTKTINNMKLVLGAIGGISLLVAAIGITNTMVMAITERKREIGVMKVIGATITDIKRLFLLESAMIGLMGGSVGITICVGISKLINSDYFKNTVLKQSEISFSFEIPFTLILGGIIFTTLIGIISGYLPALKAMRSSALEAIRNE